MKRVIYRSMTVMMIMMMVMPFTVVTPAAAASAPAPATYRTFCDDNGPLCAETMDPYNYEGHYTGHDEPSVLFYSDKPGSGNSSVYKLTLPKDPPRLPKQDGSGGTFNFQLHPAFWFGMALCDSQSYPLYTDQCTPDSNANIFDNGDPTAADYIGHHPGTAFMEIWRSRARAWSSRGGRGALALATGRRLLALLGRELDLA